MQLEGHHMTPGGNRGPSTVRKSHNELVPPGLRVVPRFAIIGDMGVAQKRSE